MLKQLRLNFSSSKDADPYSADDFLLLEENSAAFHFLEKFFTQEKFSDSQFTSLILKGESSSGKTHLLHIFAKKYNAKFLKIRKNSPISFDADQFYILEDVEKIKDEEQLFHLLNSALAAKAFLVLSSKNNPQFALKDLSSRLKNIFALHIKDPNNKTIEMLLINAFSRKQIKVSSKVINFISNNIPRSYQAISDAVKLLEDHCQDNGKSLTIAKIEELLRAQK